MAQQAQFDAASAVTEDNLSEINLRQRFKELQQMNVDGTKPIYKIGIDGGWRKLGISMAVAYERMPDFDPNWSPGCLRRKTNPQNERLGRPPYPAHVLFASLTDLIPGNQWDCEPSTQMYESEVATKLVGDLDEKLENFFQQIADRFNRPSDVAICTGTRIGGIYAFDTPKPGDLYDYSALDLTDRVTADLVDTRVLASLDFAKQYTTDLASAHHLTRQLIKLILTKGMRRFFWPIPAGTYAENPNDQLEHSVGRKADETQEERKERVAKEKYSGWNKNRRDPLVYYLTHLLHGVLEVVDMQLFGAPRTCRLSSGKFGLDCETVKQLAKKRYPRVELQNDLLKKMSVISTLIALMALGQYDLVRWMTLELKNKGQAEIDDLCDSIGLVLEMFNKQIRQVTYSQTQKSTVAAWNKAFTDSFHFNENYVVLNDLSEAKAKDDKDSIESLTNSALRMVEIMAQEFTDDINEIEAKESGNSKKAVEVANKKSKQKQLDQSLLRKKEDDEEDEWLFSNRQKKVNKLPPVIKKKELDDDEWDTLIGGIQEEKLVPKKIKEERKELERSKKSIPPKRVPPPSSTHKGKDIGEEKEEEEDLLDNLTDEIDNLSPPPSKRQKREMKTTSTEEVHRGIESKQEPRKNKKHSILIDKETIDSSEEEEEEEEDGDGGAKTIEVKPRHKRKRQTHLDSDEEEKESKSKDVINLLDFLPPPSSDQTAITKQKTKERQEKKPPMSQKKQSGSTTKEKKKETVDLDGWDDGWENDWTAATTDTGYRSDSHKQPNRSNDSMSSVRGRLPTKSPTDMANEMDFY